MESVIKNIFKVTIVIKEIECTYRIVHENWIYYAVVVSTRTSECFFLYIKMGRLS